MLVLGANIAALDIERAVGIDAEEDAGDGDVGRLEAKRAVFIRGVRRLDLIEAAIDVFGQFVGDFIFGLKEVEFFAKRLAGGALFVGRLDRYSRQLAQSVRRAIGHVEGGFEPFQPSAAISAAAACSFAFEESVEKGDVLKPPAAVGLEQIAQNDAAGGFIGLNSEKHRPLVRRRDRGLGEQAADVPGLLFGSRCGSGPRPAADARGHAKR